MTTRRRPAPSARELLPPSYSRRRPWARFTQEAAEARRFRRVEARTARLLDRGRVS